MKQILMGVGVVFISAFLLGCETVKGVGRDIEGAGSTVQSSMSRR